MDEALVKKINHAIEALQALEPDLDKLSINVTNKMSEFQGTETNQIFLHFDRQITQVGASCSATIKKLKNFQRLERVLAQLCALSAHKLLSAPGLNLQELCTQISKQSRASTANDSLP